MAPCSPGDSEAPAASLPTQGLAWRGGERQGEERQEQGSGGSSLLLGGGGLGRFGGCLLLSRSVQSVSLMGRAGVMSGARDVVLGAPVGPGIHGGAQQGDQSPPTPPTVLAPFAVTPCRCNLATPWVHRPGSEQGTLPPSPTAAGAWIAGQRLGSSPWREGGFLSLESTQGLAHSRPVGSGVGWTSPRHSGRTEVALQRLPQ